MLSLPAAPLNPAAKYDPFDPADGEARLEKVMTACLGSGVLSQVYSRYVVQEKAKEMAQRDMLARRRAEMGMPEAEFETGGSALLDASAAITALWGKGSNVLLADGESLIIAGGMGTGKTTFGQQLSLGLIGLPRFEELLGYPVTAAGRVLYLAMDRPKQARRSMARMVCEEDRQLLNDMLVFRPGPPPTDFAIDPNSLVDMCVRAKASVVVVDSIKDAAVGLSDDAVGAGYNRARQTAISAGIQVVELHHTRKSGQGGKEQPSVDSIYGSTWITSGAGSILLLEGEPGDDLIKVHHVKQPMSVVGPLTIIHDHAAGRSRVQAAPSLLELGREEPLTAARAAEQLFGSAARAQIERARRQLERHEKEGLMVRVQTSGGGANTWETAL